MGVCFSTFHRRKVCRSRWPCASFTRLVWRWNTCTIIISYTGILSRKICCWMRISTLNYAISDGLVERWNSIFEHQFAVLTSTCRRRLLLIKSMGSRSTFGVSGLCCMSSCMVCSSGAPPFSGQTIKEIQEEFKNKKIEINANLSSDVKDLLKCVLRRNPNQRYNIKQVLQHPAILSRMDEFNRPISEEQFALLITSYMQNCGMSDKRDHPEEIKKYKESHKNFANEWFGKTGGESGGFFDDVPVQFPSSSYYGPLPAPFFPTDPGFFDNIPENLSFRKSRQNSQRTDNASHGSNPHLQQEMSSPTQTYSQPGSSSRAINSSLLPLQAGDLKRSESFPEQNQNQISSRQIKILGSPSNDINIPNSSMRTISVGQINNQITSIQNIGLQQQNSTKAANAERKEETQSVASIPSVKKIQSDPPTFNLPPSKPEPAKTTQTYQTNKVTPQYPPPVESKTNITFNPYEVQKSFQTVTFQNAQSSQNLNSNLGYKQTKSENVASQPQLTPIQQPSSQPQQQRQGQQSPTKNLNIPITQPTNNLTSVFRPTNPQNDNSNATFVNYIPYVPQTPSSNKYQQSTGSTGTDQLGTMRTSFDYGNSSYISIQGGDKRSEEVGYFPYEIEAGNHSAVMNNLNEQFNRQQQSASVKQFISPYNQSSQQTVDYQLGAKHIQIDTRNNTMTKISPSVLGQPTQAGQAANEPHITNRPPSWSTGSTNVKFMNAVSVVKTDTNTPISIQKYHQPQQISSNQDRKYSYPTESYSTTNLSNKVESTYQPQGQALTGYSFIQKPLPPTRTPNAKFVDHNNSMETNTLNYNTYSGDTKLTGYTFNDPNSFSAHTYKAQSFLKPQTRPASIEKKREFSGDVVRVVGKGYATTYQR